MTLAPSPNYRSLFSLAVHNGGVLKYFRDEIMCTLAYQIVVIMMISFPVKLYHFVAPDLFTFFRLT